MISFSEYIVQSKPIEEGLKDFYKRAKRSFKRKMGSQEKSFIAPFYKGQKTISENKIKEEYGLFVDWDEGVIYDIDTKPESFSISDKLIKDGLKMIKKEQDKFKISEDNFYHFVVGVGYEEDIKDFCQKELKAPYAMEDFDW